MKTMLMTMADTQKMAIAGVPYPPGIMACGGCSAIGVQLVFIENRFPGIRMF
jgi:hypothetical protein